MKKGHSVMNFGALATRKKPFPHWVADDFISPEVVRLINASWPDVNYPGWRIEGASWAKKGSLLFPQRLPRVAQDLAEQLCSPWALGCLSEIVGVQLHADPWLREGPETPRLGGGLHEIPSGGLLKVHVDFEKHPSGLKRVCNLLVYLNEDWQEEWGGQLELHGPKHVESIAPFGGRAVLFLTTPESWHGHPHPLACPMNRSRRSLAMYYYAESGDAVQRPKTVYRSK